MIRRFFYYAKFDLKILTPSCDEIGLLIKATNMTFRGELVPPDPADEPAAELLKRLAASRAAADLGYVRLSRRTDAIPASASVE